MTPSPWSRAASAPPSPGAQESTSLWARPVPSSQERATARARKMAEGLPAWDPLPPGEIIVKRRAT